MQNQHEIELEKLRRFADGGYLFAIVDSCVNPEILNTANQLDPSRALCLFRDTPLQEYYAVAPFLFQVDGSVLQWILDTLGKIPWGVFVLTKASMEDLTHHLQRLFVAVLPDGYRWYFRYYDPRILPAYLAGSDELEKRSFFGPVRGFVIADADAPKFWLLEGPPGGSAEPTSAANLEPLKISREQYLLLEAVAEQEFQRRVRVFLCQHLPQQTANLAPDVLAASVSNGVTRARQHGMKGEAAITAFVAALFEIGPRFDGSALFRKLASNPEIAPDSIMEILLNTAAEEDWAEMRGATPPSHSMGGNRG